jgi:hypothetical protein
MNPKHQDNHFSAFAMGATVGVIAALLFGTDEGRKIVREVLDAIPNKIKDPIESSLRGGTPTRQSPSMPIITPEETPHHATFAHEDTFNEAPPPPPPAVHPFRPL